jgi:tRNA-2-methylthio-N6-dimethylallyladenosine synthase
MGFKKAYIETFGCQMNEYDSERILFYLEKLGYRRILSSDKADIIVINTCAVREKAENKLFGHLGRFKNIKKQRGDDILICVGGCVAQNMGIEIQEKFPFVDIVFGTHNISELPLLIEKRISGIKNVCSVIKKGSLYPLYEVRRINKYKALLPVSIGCNNFCSFCIVPYVRGRELSFKPDLIIEYVKKLIEEGVIEVTLVGQNVNSYGKDLDDKICFSDLLEKVSDIKGLKRIRFMTSNPKDFSEDLIQIIKERNNIVNHIHLPLQSGSNRILKLMRRKYSREDYISIIENIKNNIDNCSITTDTIVGFPGEERADFNDTLEIVKQVRFARAFTFIYSPRKGTPAALMPDPVKMTEKKNWFKELIEVQNRISFEVNEQYIGKIVKVLVEGLSPKNEKMLEGRMENNMIVIFSGNRDLIGKIIDLKIEKAMSFYLIGKIAGKVNNVRDACAAK